MIARLVTTTVLLALLCVVGTSRAERTVGLQYLQAGYFPGYTLFSTLTYPEVFLIDIHGERVHSWPTTFVTGNTQYLLENGDLLRCVDPGGNDVFLAGGDGGLVQQLDWDGNVVMEFLYSNDDVRHHHDIEPMPNGNILVIAWEYKSEADCVQAGRDPATLDQGELWPDHIIEIEPDGLGSASIVWEWHAWDHLIQDFDETKDNFGVVADHPELIDVNFFRDGRADWLHVNAVDYNPQLDQIVISVPFLDEFWIIDHSTTTEEAAGHTGGNSGMGGDILYRWGNPQAYDRGTEADRKLWNQHDVDWIPAGLPGAGNIMVFNNGNGRPGGNYSTMEEIVTPVDGNGMYPSLGPGEVHGPATQSWILEPDPQVYSGGLSSTQRVANGNTVVCVGRGGRFFEVRPDLVEVWVYENPVNINGPLEQGDDAGGTDSFRAERYALDYPGFAGRDLTPQGPIESYAPAGLESQSDLRLHYALRHSPNPVTGPTSITFRLSEPGEVRLDVFDVHGRRIETLASGEMSAGSHQVNWDTSHLSAGLYTYVLSVGEVDVVPNKLLVVD